MLAERSPRAGAPEAASSATKTAAARRRTKVVPAFVTSRLWRDLLFSVIYTTFYSSSVTSRRRDRLSASEAPASSSGPRYSSSKTCAHLRDRNQGMQAVLGVDFFSRRG